MTNVILQFSGNLFSYIFAKKKLMNDKQYAVGIDIGGTNTKFGIVNGSGQVIKHNSIPTQSFRTFEMFIEELCLQISEMINQNTGKNEIAGIGIGAPNGNYFRGTIEDAANLNWKGILPLANSVKKKFNLPVKVTNDANAAALAEKIFGDAKNLNNFIEITLGTGLGSGIFTEGKLLYGHSGFAGELGHVKVKENGRLCGCGRKGCLETYVSATGIVKTAKEFLSHSAEKSLLRNFNDNLFSSKDIYELALQGDKLALKIFDFTAEILGKALADFTAVLSPEVIFFFGGLAEAGDLLLKPAEAYMNANLLSVYKNTVKIKKSGLQKGEAGILGAAALILE